MVDKKFVEYCNKVIVAAEKLREELKNKRCEICGFLLSDAGPVKQMKNGDWVHFHHFRKEWREIDIDLKRLGLIDV